jgi:hypothetical protein
MYAQNLRQLMQTLPERWHVAPVLKENAYGHDINIIGPVAAKIAPIVCIKSNSGARALADAKAQMIMRIKPTSYSEAKEAVQQKLNVVELLGRSEEIEAVSRVAEETGEQIPAQLYLFDHYDSPWGWNVDTSEQLQKVVDGIDPRKIRITGLFAHVTTLSRKTISEASSDIVSWSARQPPITTSINKFLRIACPAAVRLAEALGPQDPPILVHWGASSEMIRLQTRGKLEIPKDIMETYAVCFSHPKISFLLRVGSASYGFMDVPNLFPAHSLISWNSKVSRIENGNAFIPVRLRPPDDLDVFRRQAESRQIKTSVGPSIPMLVHNIMRNATEAPQMDLLTIRADGDLKVGDDVCILCAAGWSHMEEQWHVGVVKRMDIANCLTQGSIHHEACLAEVLS